MRDDNARLTPLAIETTNHSCGPPLSPMAEHFHSIL